MRRGLLFGFLMSVAVGIESLVIEKEVLFDSGQQITFGSSSSSNVEAHHHPHWPEDDLIQKTSSAFLETPSSKLEAENFVSDPKEEETPTAADGFKKKILDLERLENELKEKKKEVYSLSEGFCGRKSVWECEGKFFCVVGVVLGREGMMDLGRCVQRLDREGKKEGEVPKGLDGVKKRGGMVLMMLELSVVVLGSLLVVLVGMALRGKRKGEEEGLPFFEPRAERGRRKGFWKWLFGNSGRSGGDEEGGVGEKEVEVERVEEEVVRMPHAPPPPPPPPQPRVYMRREIEQHIETWGIGVQEGVNGGDYEDESRSVGGETLPESEGDTDSEPESEDNLEGVTMSQEIASFRDAFGLVEDMLAAAEKRSRQT